MSESGGSGSRRGRVHDAKGAREAILNAAEVVFAEHGFSGARIDAIAAESSYNKSLLFQYFGDKLGLYTEVIRRADQEMNEVQARVLAPLLEDETIASNACKFKALLEMVATAVFDYLVEHPRFLRIMLWEMAENWQTYTKIASQFPTDDIDLFEGMFHKAHSAGLLRSDFVPVIQLTTLMQICLSYLAFLPLYQVLLPGKELSSAAALAGARKYIVDLVVAGTVKDVPETTP
jgi:TetR/AcrR family transcriptional regulator